MRGEEREYAELLGGYETAILVTRGPDGHFHARPMATQERHAEDGIWFATEAGSDKCRHIESDPHVAVAFHQGKHDADYLSVSGRAEIVRDRARIHAMWDASWKPWFPDGPDQADLVLIRVVPQHVEWVKPPGGKLGVLKTMAKRTLTHQREPPDEKKTLDL
jgi:general stress protein 26